VALVLSTIFRYCSGTVHDERRHDVSEKSSLEVSIDSDRFTRSISLSLCLPYHCRILGAMALKKAKNILDQAEETLKLVDKAHIFTISKEREFPRFEAAEIVSGGLLGKGGFSTAHEVEAILLEYTKESVGEEAGKKKPVLQHSESSAVTPLDSSQAKNEHDEHYDVETAREFMSKNYLRVGSARYAIKKLKSELGAVDQTRGALDLAIEIKYLSTLWHPNIGEWKEKRNVNA